MPHLRWDIAGGVSQEQVDTIDMQEAEKLIDQSAPQSICQFHHFVRCHSSDVQFESVDPT